MHLYDGKLSFDRLILKFASEDRCVEMDFYFLGGRGGGGG